MQCAYYGFLQVHMVESMAGFAKGKLDSGTRTSVSPNSDGM